MKTKILISICLVCLLCGAAVGLTLGLTVFKPDVNKAIVKQLKKDDKAVQVIEKKAEVRNAKKENIKADIQAVPDISGCIDFHSPELHSIVLESFNSERP